MSPPSGTLLERRDVRGRLVEFRTVDDSNPFFKGWVMAWGPSRLPEEADWGPVQLVMRNSLGKAVEAVDEYYRGPGQPSPYSDP